jgi:hypothetical protein
VQRNPGKKAKGSVCIVENGIKQYQMQESTQIRGTRRAISGCVVTEERQDLVGAQSTALTIVGKS